MVDEKEVAETPKEITAETPKETAAGNEGEGNTTPVLILLIIVPVLLVSCTLFYLFTSYRAQPDNNITAPVESETPIPELMVNPNELASSESVAITKAHIELQPNCTIEEYFEALLEDVLIALYVKDQLCTPEDFHNLEKHNMPNLTSKHNKVHEPKGHFVIYIAVGLLLTSLAAALVDLYKVKGRPSKTKPQLTKRCSLADLTVLRHSRRESMRKDSIVDEQRAPIKLLGARPPPELRRCSFPVSYPGGTSYGRISPHQGSRKTSLDYYDDVYSYDFHHNRVVRIIRR